MTKVINDIYTFLGNHPYITISLLAISIYLLVKYGG